MGSCELCKNYNAFVSLVRELETCGMIKLTLLIKFYLCFSKATEVLINNDILEDIQVIEPQIRRSDQKLYEVSKKAPPSVKLISLF